HKEIKKRHQAQYRYMRLNQQVNPHFLFNSLNVLDCLVVDGQNEKASTYIHKLSSLYRYMLRNDDEMLVKLKDEMYFVSQYVDLLQVRFPEGFEVRTDIPEEMMNLNVVPCSVQLLIENAVKHNSISSEKPLVVRVFSQDGRHLRVSNNICPKLTAVNSTGTGLKYLRQQYNDISGEDITVTDTGEEFMVDLPTI
ncbi:MAG: sensor histidine kinase, partial [Candidatus Cryptobacteroides sp.]